jgi:hypothetical protein
MGPSQPLSRPRLLSLASALALPLASAAALLPGCPGDSDGDGSPDSEDCRPEDPAIFPGAEEIAGDGIDSDCDGDPDPVGDDDDAADDDDSVTDPGDFDVADAVTGDWTCKGTLAGVIPGESGELVGTVEDFQEDEPVASAHVQIWPANNPEDGAGEAEEYLTDGSGVFTVPSGVLSACQFFAARVWTEFDPPETYQTYQINIAVAGTPPYSETFNSVAFSTYQLLPLTVGVEPEPGKGIAAGRVRDCAGEPVANVEASVGALDLATGAVTPADAAMRYFTDEDPDGDQPWTSADGLFGAMNTAPGEALNLLAWGIPQDEAHCERAANDAIIRPEGRDDMCLLAYTSVLVLPDSVNISNINLKPFPDACYESEAVGR